jgi:3-hydroxyacyl-CoA dehydrogenase
MTFKTIAIVGTGVIGASWATHFLSRGYSVIATNRSGTDTKLRAMVAEQWRDAERLGLAEHASPTRLRFTPSLAECVRQADFIQENGPEGLDIKRVLFKAIDDASPAHAIIASSASGLLISEVQSVCRHPERVLTGHPFNPPHLIPLVEVVGGTATSEEFIESALDFYRLIGKRPIRVRKEIKGHIANRLQAALRREAYGLVEHGIATVADIDAAIAHGPGLRWSLLGPFLNQHLGGGEGGIQHHLDHLGPSMDEWWQDLYQTRLTEELKTKIVAGVANAIQGWDMGALHRERDQALVDLLRIKGQLKHLP